MKRSDICAADDHEAITRLLNAIGQLGGHFDGEDASLGVGLHRFPLPGGELTVFVDAWAVDVAGPDHLVDRVLAILAGLS